MTARSLPSWCTKGGRVVRGPPRLCAAGIGVWKAQASSIALRLVLSSDLQEQTANYQQQGPVSSQLPRLSRVAAMAVPRAGNCVAQEVEASVSWFLYAPKERNVYPSYPLTTLLMDPISASGSVQGAGILLWSQSTAQFC